MKKSLIPITIAIAAITLNSALSQTANISTAANFSNRVPQEQYPFIIYQPNDQSVPFGSNATFTVTAENAQGYQWLRNGNVLPNATSNTLTIQNAGIQDVGIYSCDINKGFQYIPTRSAQLQVYTNWIDPQTGVDPLVVYSFPYPNGGGGGSCPGPYAGFVAFSPGGSYWGYLPDTTNGNTVFTATDLNATNTKVQYVGEYGDIGCNQTTVTVPYPAMSPQYEFFIYFTSNVPTNAYPITLSGFYP